MGRPAKFEEERRGRRLTIYLTPVEEALLNSLSQATDTDKTKIILAALQQYIAGLVLPPESLRTAKSAAIMQQDKEYVSGYVCDRGHAFWLEAAWPAPPRSCPACGGKEIKTAWGGVVKRGFI